MTHEELAISAVSGNLQDLNELVTRLIPKVESLATFHCQEANHPFIERDDLIQEGCIALTHAITSFRPERENLFWTFAKVVVHNAMTDYIRKTITTDSQRIILHLEDKTQTKNPEHQKTYFDIFADPYIKSPLQILIESETYAEIHCALDSISFRESEYLRYRYGFDDDKEHDRTDTAKHFHLSTNRAKSLEQLALDHIRSQLPWGSKTTL